MGRIRVKKLAAAVVLASTACSTAGAPPRPEAKPGPVQQLIVFYADGQSSAARQAVSAAGGVLKGQDGRLGYLLVDAADPRRISASPAVVGVTADRRIG